MCNEGFVIFFTSMLITSFIGSLDLKMKCQSTTYLRMEVYIYIGIWTLKVKCTQYGICGKVAFKNARAMVFSKSNGWATIFGRVLKIQIFWIGICYECVCIFAVLYPWYYTTVLYNIPKEALYYTTLPKLNSGQMRSQSLTSSVGQAQDRDPDRHYVQFETTRLSNRYNEGYKVLQVDVAALH